MHLAPTPGCLPWSRYNEAEFLVDFVTEADRKGHSDSLAEHYANSQLCKDNLLALEGWVAALCRRSLQHTCQHCSRAAS